MSKRQLELLFDANKHYRSRARRILAGLPQGIHNPEALSRQRAYQNAYRKAHRKEANLANRRYYRKWRKLGNIYYGTARYLNATKAQQEKIAAKKELYAAIERVLSSKATSDGFQKLLQLSLQFGASREKASSRWNIHHTAKIRRTLDLLKLSPHKRRTGQSKKVNGR